jgi:4-hydroxy-tetrahydrodipicolinate synthase
VPVIRQEVPSCFVISITPFSSDGAFDEDGIRTHLRRMADSGIGVYLGGGGSGEGYVLTRDETRRLLEIGAEELRGRVPVRAMGVEPRRAEEMVALVELAEETGMEAAQVYSLDQGHGHRPSEEEIFRYFDDILSSVRLPVVLSTHQSVGYQLPVPMVKDFVARYPTVIGINCTHQDVRYLAAIIDAVGDRVTVHVGGPQQALTAWSLGATGYLCSEGNLAPHLCVEVVEAYKRGDAHAMIEAFGKVLRLSGELYGAGGIRATKAVLSAYGLPAGVPRRPQLPVADAERTRVVGLVEELGIPSVEGWSPVEFDGRKER